MPPDASASKSVFCLGPRSFAVPICPPWVMGIVNVTPDSFSDGGTYFDRDRAVARGLEQIAEGASLIDIGAESTRPGSTGVDAREQIRRAIPVIEQLRVENPSIPISIDTTSAQVARAAIEAGATMVNDTSALRDDPNMVTVLAEGRASVILMHRRGTPLDMQAGGGPVYDHLMDDIVGFLGERIEFAVAHGVDRMRLAVDPGLGFGKQGADNLKILAQLQRLTESGRPVVVGASRKKFIGDVLQIAHPVDRLIGSVACATVGYLRGASILRVHDVAETVQAVQMAHAISGSA